MKKIVTFGEIMMRLNPSGYLRFVQADSFEASYAGGEANVAVSLANYGLDAAFVSKVPAHDIGQCAINALRQFGVDTSMVLRGGDRLGVYFVEKGASQRPSKVIYDRANSAIATADAGEFDWETIFRGAECFHFTGITPALSSQMAKACMDACKAAKKLGLMPYVDVCIANEEDCKDVFGIAAEGTDIAGGKLGYEGYISVAKQLADRFGCKKVAITLRSSLSANDNDWAGMLYNSEKGTAVFSPTYRIHIVDRVGGGDSFGGGLLYSLITGKQDQDAINFAVAASCLKHSIEHDFNLVTVQEVENLAKGNASGRIQR